MKFTLRTAGRWYDKKDKERLEKLGFTFEIGKSIIMPSKEYKINCLAISPTIEINSIRELLKFIETHGTIVISEDGEDNDILIYDDYIE